MTVKMETSNVVVNRGDNRNHQDANGRKGSYDEKIVSHLRNPTSVRIENRPHNDNKGREKWPS